MMNSSIVNNKINPFKGIRSIIALNYYTQFQNLTCSRYQDNSRINNILNKIRVLG